MATVLIADDDQDMLDLLTLTVTALGHTVEAVVDGGAALDSLTASHFDLAILDVSMPTMTGIEVVRAVRAANPHRGLPIILLSANTTSSDVRAGLGAGADEYHFKPVALAALRNRIHALLTPSD